MAGKIYFLTGGTGFVGSFLAVELLKKGHFVIFLARGKGGLFAKDRVDEALKFVDPEVKSLADFYRVLEGDVTERDLGLSSSDKEYLMKIRPDEFFHSAGSVDFAEKNRDWTYKVNYIGTVNTLRLATELGVDHFHHMSTLYVAGNRSGRIFENQLYEGQSFNNIYEETKAKAEDLIKFWSDKMGIPYSIYRLPIVIGDSKTGKASTFTGFYGFFKPFWNLEKSIRGKINDPRLQEAGICLTDGHISAPLFVKCSDLSNIDLVPIDWVVRNIVELSERLVQNKTYHFSHDYAPSSTSVIKEVLPMLGLEGLQYVNVNGKRLNLEHRNRTLGAFQRMVDSITEIYFEYAVNKKVFNNANMVQDLGGDYHPPPKIENKILKVMIEYAKERQFQKPSFA